MRKETCLLAKCYPFWIYFTQNRNVVSAWSSGTGGAGVTGALTYALFKYMNILPETTLLLMIFVPVIQCVTFFIVLQEPHGLWTTLISPSSSTSLINDHNVIQPAPVPIAADGYAPLTLSQKIDYLPNMLKYVLPLLAVYLCEYLINQGLVSRISWRKKNLPNLKEDCLFYVYCRCYRI